MSKRLTKEEIEDIKDHNQRCYGWPDDKDYGNPRMVKLLSHIEAVEEELASKNRKIKILRNVLADVVDGLAFELTNSEKASEEAKKRAKFSSGLNVDEAIRSLREEALDFFRSTVVELVSGPNISTKTAAEVATNLAIGFISPITSQIDPIRVGEIHRATKIALAYGERLIEGKRGNIDSKKKLVQLVQGYPDHGFVIDFQEANNLFKSVRKHSEREAAIGNSLKDVLRYPSPRPNICILEEKEENKEAKDYETQSNKP